MRLVCRVGTAVVLLSVLAIATAHAQTGVGYVVGFVRDSDRSEFGAAVRVDSVRGDLPGVEAGRFVLAVPPGRHTLHFVSMTELPFATAPIEVRAGETTFVDTIVLRPSRAREVYLGCRAPGATPAGATCAEGRVLGAVAIDKDGVGVVRDKKTWERLLARSRDMHPRAVDWEHEMVILTSSNVGMTYVDVSPGLTVNRAIYTAETVTVVLGADSVISRHARYSGAEGIWFPQATAIPRSGATVVFQFLAGQPVDQRDWGKP